jgi:Protein phosphatase 2C
MVRDESMESKIEWLCTGKSVMGASHKRSQLPNQDAIAWYPNHPELAQGSPIILAISDGHGSPRNFRSDIGSQKAVEAALKVIHELFISKRSQEQSPEYNLKAIKDIAENKLPERLVREWINSVKKHYQENPFQEDEFKRLVQKDGEAAIVTEPFILYIQLGDGDILCVDSQGNTKAPISKDSRLIANETTSLCMENAWNEIRVRLEVYAENSLDNIPALILVSTDGYANSYPSDEEFCKIGPDYLEMIRSQGIQSVHQELNTFLDETSQGGSGDDITLGIISRTEENLEKNIQALELEDMNKIPGREQQVTLYQCISVTALVLSIVNFSFIGWKIFFSPQPKPNTDNPTSPQTRTTPTQPPTAKLKKTGEKPEIVNTR